MNLVELGARIKQLRERRALKQLDIANALQISAQAVSKWERGENAPDIAVLLELSLLLGVTTDTLLGRAEKSNDTFEATVFCTGINHFADRSTQMAPRDVALWANGIFHPVTESVVRHDGVPVKYVGDGFLGFFSGPNHARRALDAALDAKTHVHSPDLVITLNSGDIYLGSIGHSEYARPDIIGDTVNTSFLVMSWVAKHLPERLGLTESVVVRLGESEAWTGPTRVRIPILNTYVKVFAPKRLSVGSKNSEQQRPRS